MTLISWRTKFWKDQNNSHFLNSKPLKRHQLNKSHLLKNKTINKKTTEINNRYEWMTPNRHNNIGPIHSHRSHGQFNYSRNTNISRWKQSYVGETKVQSKSENDNVRRVATKSSRNSLFLFLHICLCFCLELYLSSPSLFLSTLVRITANTL